ncbi:hypothetical protein [Arthrobacter sp. ISL-69]|uniref:hypothetical protein n=1 Tax=Arthrobacter sp. ISL-69 TaxID=2819113 RepID=UPI001BED051C|nr:hypothetical protein [Arthrobacter sp. ISL-69]
MNRRPHHWLPGLIAGRSLVHPDGTACTLDFGEVYPSGFMAQISVRFRGTLTRNQQREIFTQVDSYHRNTPTLGPQLMMEQEDSLGGSAEVLTTQGSNTRWTIMYWFDQPSTPEQLTLTFTWPEQALESLFVIPGEEVDRAKREATELWIPDQHEYGYTGE